MDAVSPDMEIASVVAELESLSGQTVFQISAVTQQNLDQLLQTVWDRLDQMEQEAWQDQVDAMGGTSQPLEV